jgi:hypothetical protein
VQVYAQPLSVGGWAAVPTRSALPCNAVYLDLLRERNPARLATAAAFATEGKGPTFLGANYIHPTARIHPTAKVDRASV